MCLTETCKHKKVAPINALELLPHSQAGAGRHRCAVCAFYAGENAGRKQKRITSSLTRCKHGNFAPIPGIKEIPDSQAGTGRHKCIVCAYALGLSQGEWLQNPPSFNSLKNAKDAIDTESRTHEGEDPFLPDKEGQRTVGTHVQYERSEKNRAKAIEYHGTKCLGCGFDFDNVYGGSYARSYIEVHHIESVSRGERIVDPRTDLIPLCSNCHSMVHRNRGKILSLLELRKLIERSKKRSAS